MPKAVLKSNQEIAVLLMMKPARTAAGRIVQATVLARVEIAIAIETELSK